MVFFIREAQELSQRGDYLFDPGIGRLVALWGFHLSLIHISILRMTGLNVRIGSLLPEVTVPTRVELPDGDSLLLEPLLRTGNRLGVEGYDPCAILLNNDLSAGIPPILQGLDEQYILPPCLLYTSRCV